MNKDKKQPLRKRVPDFIGDKGFYIVLFLCVAVIGITSWILSSKLTGTGLVDTPVINAKITSVPEDATSAPAPTVPPEQVEPPATSAPLATPEPTPEQESEQTLEVIDELPKVSESEDVVEPAAQHFLWPLSGTVETPHSVEALLYDKTMADWRTHTGIDIASPLGATVMAASDGTVEKVYDDEMYGTTVIIRHVGGLTSVYSNLAAMPTVSVGDTVKIGDIIGAVGDTALAEAGEVTHLHFGMELDGVAIDPTWYLPTR